MGYFKIYKTLNESEIVEALNISAVHNKLTYVPFRVVPCESDGSVKIPTGYTVFPTKQKKL